MPTENKIVLSDSYLYALTRLPKEQQKKVNDFYTKFRKNAASSSLNLEQLKGLADKKIGSARIDSNYRIIFAKEPSSNLYLLLWVGHHDEAYQWAQNKRVDVNQFTGAIQLYQVSEPSEQEMIPQDRLLFREFSDRDLEKLGVPEMAIPGIRTVQTMDEFPKLSKIMPRDAYQNLAYLIEGDLSIDEVIELVQSCSTEARSDSLEDALDAPATKSSFVVIPGEGDLQGILEEEFEAWRVFLHPIQRVIAEKDYSGPARVTGGAGTGKTVVAMHRAKYLVAQLKRGEKIFFTTYAKNLANDIEENLKKICTPQEMGQIEVKNLDAWVAAFLPRSGSKLKLLYSEKEIDSFWENAIKIASPLRPYPLGFYKDEWKYVATAQEKLDREHYMAADRKGRGTRLSEKEREQVWQVFEQYQKLLKEAGKADNYMAMQLCRRALLNAPNASRGRYKHVIVDEAQDLSGAALWLLRALAGEERENDIFIVGDAHQRIYQNHASLSKCGIHIAGRSHILRYSYRTTEETRKYAMALLRGYSFDDLDKEIDLQDDCASATHGEAPFVRNFYSKDQEIQFVKKEIQRLHNGRGVKWSDICVVARSEKYLNDFIVSWNQDFQDAKNHVFQLKDGKPESAEREELRVATMHRVKGLEFRYVFVMGVKKGLVPLDAAIKSAADEAEREEIRKGEACILYVAITRAQERVYITSFGQPSEILP